MYAQRVSWREIKITFTRVSEIRRIRNKFGATSHEISMSILHILTSVYLRKKTILHTLETVAIRKLRTGRKFIGYYSSDLS